MALSKTKQKEQRIAAVKSQYSIPFEIEDAAVDLREMAKNYADGIIPFRDIGKIVDAVNGPAPIARTSIDPRTLKTPNFAWVEIDKFAINPIFQRDMMPNHIAKIEKNFQSDMLIVPCAVKHPITGLYLLWDGHHTARVCERMGWTHVPVWYTEAVLDPNKSEEKALRDAVKDLTFHAGKSMITINDTGKRKLDRYNKHCINYEIGDVEAVSIQNIVNSNNCQIKRVSKRAGDISDINNLYSSYEMKNKSGIEGVYLARSLNFHRTTWPMEEVRNVMMYSMSLLYCKTEAQTNVLLPPDFDVEFGKILTGIYGFSKAVQGDDQNTTGLRKAFVDFFNMKSIVSDIGNVVTSGLILTYNKHGSGRFKLAPPDYTYTVL